MLRHLRDWDSHYKDIFTVKKELRFTAALLSAISADPSQRKWSTWSEGFSDLVIQKYGKNAQHTLPVTNIGCLVRTKIAKVLRNPQV